MYLCDSYQNITAVKAGFDMQIFDKWTFKIVGIIFSSKHYFYIATYPLN